MKRPQKLITESLRPLTSRALTSAIDTLRFELKGADILEIYAGTGCFSEKALKEGASSATLIEKELSHIRNSLTKLPNVTVLIGDAFHSLALLRQRRILFQVVFADPPFSLCDEQWLSKTLESVRPLTPSKAIFLVKAPKRMIASENCEGFSIGKSTVFGESKLIYYAKNGQGRP